MLTTRRPRRRPTLLALAGTLAVVALVGAGSSGAVGRYTDSTGDSHGGPDITGVTVASDAGGQIVFTIRTADLPPEQGVGTLLALNTDLDSSTGDPDMLGADYAFYVDEGEHMYEFMRTTGSDWEDTAYSTVQVRSGRSGVTISVNQSELGGTQSFNFWTRTIRGDYENGQLDDAPDDGTWNYTLAAAGPDIKDVLVATSPPSGPKAGKPFTITPALLSLPSDEGLLDDAARPESYTCSATLGSKAVAGSGTGRCTFKLKKSARGKKLVVALTVTYQGATKTKQFAYRVG